MVVRGGLWLHPSNVHSLKIPELMAKTLKAFFFLKFCLLASSSIECNYPRPKMEALESVMCDVIKIRLKRRDAMRSKMK